VIPFQTPALSIGGYGSFADWAVVFISIISLISAIYFAVSQSRYNRATLALQRKLNKTTVLPICDIEIINLTNHLEINILNAGLGPLIVKSIRFHIPGTDTDSLINVIRAGGKYLDINVKFQRFSSPFAILPNEKHQILSWQARSDDYTIVANGEETIEIVNEDVRQHINSLRDEISKAEIKVDYTDAYDDEVKVKKEPLGQIEHR